MLGATHRGVQLDTHLRVAFSYTGTTQIELIEPLESQPTVYREFLDDGRSGLHHLAFWPEDFQKTFDKLVAAGCNPCLHMPMDPLPPNYYLEPPAGGTSMVELSHRSSKKAEHYEAMRSCVADWDGNDPIRRYTSRDELASDIGAPSLTAIDSSQATKPPASKTRGSKQR